MLIKLKNKTTIDSESILSIRLADNIWCVKLTNGYETALAKDEFGWLMTTVGNMIKVNDELALSMHAIVMFEPNESGYLIGWEGEPPIQITKEKGDLLTTFISGHKKQIVLEDRIAFLLEQNVEMNYNEL